MTPILRRQYPSKWQYWRNLAIQFCGGRCQVCGVEQYSLHISARGIPYLMYLHAAHVYVPDGSNEKGCEKPLLMVLCPLHHWQYDAEVRARKRALQNERNKHRQLLARKTSNFKIIPIGK